MKIPWESAIAIKAGENQCSVMPQYITAYDPLVGKRAVHMVEGGKAISLVTGHSFPYPSKKAGRPRR